MSLNSTSDDVILYLQERVWKEVRCRTVHLASQSIFHYIDALEDEGCVITQWHIYVPDGTRLGIWVQFAGKFRGSWIENQNLFFTLHLDWSESVHFSH